jgi:hypothetical protein
MPLGADDVWQRGLDLFCAIHDLDHNWQVIAEFNQLVARVPPCALHPSTARVTVTPASPSR